MKRKRSMNRFAAVLLSAVLMVTLALAGCTGKKQNETNSPATPAATTGATQESTAPEEAEPTITTPLTYWVGFDVNAAVSLKDLSEVGTYRLKEQTTGVKVMFEHPASPESFNLMMATNKLPDVIETGWNAAPGGPEQAIANRKIIALNDYIDKYAPNFKKLLEENPDLEKQLKTDSGDIYVFPFLRMDPELKVFYGLALRQDWLDALGLATPTTIDEWHTVLKAFKEGDPNGNGKADEIPLYVNQFQFDYSYIFAGAWGLTNGFFQENGKVKFSPLEEKYREFLGTMHAWYAEGLIDKDFAATDDKLFDAKLTGNLVGASGMFLSGGIGKYMDLMKGEPGFTLTGAPYPVLNKGDTPQLGQMDVTFNGYGAAISGSNKQIEGTVRWLDYNYSDEGKLAFNFGIEGESYTLENGEPKLTDRILHNPDGLSVNQAGAQYMLAGNLGPFVQDKRFVEQITPRAEQKEALKLWSQPTNEKLLPPLIPNQEEGTKLAAIMGDVNTYFAEMFVKFIMGVEPMDNFDKFVETLRKLGIEEAIAIQQAILDRFNQR